MKRLLLSTLLLAASFGSAAASSILIDFGSSGNLTPGNFNNVSSGSATIPNLIASDGSSTGISLNVVGFHVSANTGGTTTGVGNFPSSATSDSLYGNTATWQGLINPQITMTFSNVAPDQLLTFSMFASRMNATDVRTALYTIEGLNSGSAVLNAASNVDQFAVVSDIQATAEGTITFTMTKDVTNNQGPEGFFYLGAMEITITPVPEPSTYALIGGVAILGFAIVRRRKSAAAVAAE